MKRAANLKFIADASVAEIASALLAATDPRAESALKFDRVQPLSLDLRSLFRAEPRHRTAFAQAIVRAITDWSSAYGLPGLTQLSLAAAYIRASDAVPALARILDSGPLNRFQAWSSADDDTREAVATIVQVVAGFAPSVSVHFALERWLHEPRFQPACAAVIAKGLCACDPESYKQYLLQFLNLAEVYSENYEVDAVLQEMSRTIGVARVARDLEEWDMPVYAQLLNALAGYPESPAEIDRTENGEPVLVIRGSELVIPHDVPLGEKTSAIFRVNKNRLLRDKSSWASRIRERERKSERERKRA